MTQPQAHVQSRIVRNVIVMVIVMVTSGYVMYRWMPLTVPRNPSMADRLVFTLRWNVLSMSVLLAAIFVVAGKRFMSAQYNPFATEDVHVVQVHLRVLQNTLEQLVCSLLAQLATVTYLDETQLKLIPIIVILFVVGRVVFWIGYLNPIRGGTNRSYGIPFIILPTAAMTVYCIGKLLL